MKIISLLYTVARKLNDYKAISSGNPTKILRRAKNKIVGRLIARTGIWR